MGNDKIVRGEPVYALNLRVDDGQRAVWRRLGRNVEPDACDSQVHEHTHTNMTISYFPSPAANSCVWIQGVMVKYA